MIEGLEYKLLTKEEKQSFGWEDPADIAIAVEVARNRVVGLITLDITKRRTFCDTCKDKCAVGYVVWTQEELRSQGVLSDLGDWAHQQLGIDPARIYIDYRCTLTEDQAAVLWARNLTLPPNFQFTPGATTVDNVQRTEEWIRRLSDALGYE